MAAQTEAQARGDDRPVVDWTKVAAELDEASYIQLMAKSVQACWPANFEDTFDGSAHS